MDGNYTFFIILCFQTWSLSCERMTTPCWSTRFWICSSRPPCASSQSRTYYEYFFALKDVICIILGILLWGKLALWSNLCVLIHKWEKSSLCGMGKKIGNGPPCENSSYTFPDRIFFILRKIAKIHDLRSGLLPSWKVSVQRLEYRDPRGKRRKNKSTPRGEGIST